MAEPLTIEQIKELKIKAEEDIKGIVRGLRSELDGSGVLITGLSLSIARMDTMAGKSVIVGYDVELTIEI